MADQPQDIPLFADAPEGDTFTPASESSQQAQDINAQMAADMVKHGAWTQETADAFMAELAANPDGEEGLATAAAAVKPDMPEGVDPLTFDAFAPPKSISDYRLAPPPAAVEASPEQAAEMTQLFFAEGIPAPIAQQVSKLYDAACAAPPSDAQIQTMTIKTMDRLERTYGADTPRMVEAARAEIGRMAAANPKIVAMLEQSGLGSDFYVVQSIINVARARGRLK
jgi:hypothetical protein